MEQTGRAALHPGEHEDADLEFALLDLAWLIIVVGARARPGKERGVSGATWAPNQVRNLHSTAPAMLIMRLVALLSPDGASRRRTREQRVEQLLE